MIWYINKYIIYIYNVYVNHYRLLAKHGQIATVRWKQSIDRIDIRKKIDTSIEGQQQLNWIDSCECEMYNSEWRCWRAQISSFRQTILNLFWEMDIIGRPGMFSAEVAKTFLMNSTNSWKIIIEHTTPPTVLVLVPANIECSITRNDVTGLQIQFVMRSTTKHLRAFEDWAYSYICSLGMGQRCARLFAVRTHACMHIGITCK